jgi:two-component system nitrate/nitrite sensor histidine kinase NarX
MIRLAKADAGVVRVLTSDGEHLRMVASRGLPPAVVEKERLVSRHCGQCGVAIGQDRPLFDIDLAGCAERTGGSFFTTGCQAMVVVPLSNGGKLLGTYNLFLPQAFELPEEVVAALPLHQRAPRHGASRTPV